MGVAPIGVLQRLDDIIYGARLRATMPKTMDDRIVAKDEKSLAEVARWPWQHVCGRHGLEHTAQLLSDWWCLKTRLRAGKPVKSLWR